MLTAILSAYVLAPFTGMFYRKHPRIWGYLTVMLAAAIFLYLATFAPRVLEGGEVRFSYAWVPQLDIHVTFFLDGLSLFFGLLVSGFGALILWYATAYMEEAHYANRFFTYMLLFMASMLGLVLADHLILLYLFWELTSISSFLLIGYANREAEARRSALQALLVTNVGGLALLAAFLLIGQQWDTFSVEALLQTTEAAGGKHTLAIVLLLLLAAFTKSAQFPFHFWLPNAMAAPTPVSAYLHSATMVKAGIFLLFRLQPVFGDHVVWTWGLLLAGSITMVFGAVMALVQTDLKRMLAYLTISALGMMVGMTGLGTEEALQAALVYLLVHAFYKGALFMVAGGIDHQTGTRDMRLLHGLKQAMPLTMAGCVLACGSMAGLPPFFGFVGKEMVYESALHGQGFSWLLLGSTFLSSVCYVSLGLVIGYRLFFGTLTRQTPKPPTESHGPLWGAPLLLGAGGLLLGVWTEAPAYLLERGTQLISGTEAGLELSLWHGLTPALGLSLLTVLAGWGLYRGRDKSRKWLAFATGDYTLAPEQLYVTGLRRLRQVALWQTRLLQNGYLRNYLLVIFSFLVLAVLAQIIHFRLWPQALRFQLPVTVDYLYEWIPVFFMVLGLITIFGARSRLTILIATSMVGFGVAALFVFFSAPDVSMTQFLVETITLVIFMLILHRLPSHIRLESKTKFVRHLLVAILFGATMTLILLNLHGYELASPLKEYYLSHSEEEGKGLNVVNVILIDFRALDTLGEITVLGVTAIGIMTLVFLNQKK